MLDKQQPNNVSRRRVIFTGAGLVAAGAIVGATGGALTTHAAESGKAPAANPELPVMVHLRDARIGAFDVFVGEVKVPVIDPNFAAKLVDAAARAA